MAKLRIVKNRNKLDPVENDLRGLGDSALFKTFYPVAGLIIKTTNAPPIVENAAVEYVHTNGACHLYAGLHTDGSHSTDLLTLFSFALIEAEKDPLLSCHLEVCTPQAQEFETEVETIPERLNIALARIAKSLIEPGITFDGWSHTVLHSVGILKGEETVNDNYFHLSPDQCIQTLDRMMDVHSKSKNDLKKVC